MAYDELKAAILQIKDPAFDLPLAQVDGLKTLTIDNETGIVEVSIALKDYLKHQDKIKLEIIKLVKVTFKYPGIKIHVIESTYKPEGYKEIRYIAIASGKGGVGKSTVTANLAYAFKRLGKRVGIIDADIYGASIPFILNMPIKPLEVNDDDLLLPLVKDDIEVVSTEFFMPKDKPLMWRGPVLGKMLNHYFNGVKWHDDIDIILIDLPPGTGDVALDVKTMVPKSKIIVVTTPHINASHVAVKAGLGAKEIGHEVLGVVENMSFYYHQKTDEKLYLFGSGGGKLVSDKLGVPLFGEIPIGQPVDEGTYIFNEMDIQGKFFNMIAAKILNA